MATASASPTISAGSACQAPRSLALQTQYDIRRMNLYEGRLQLLLPMQWHRYTYRCKPALHRGRQGNIFTLQFSLVCKDAKLNKMARVAILICSTYTFIFVLYVIINLLCLYCYDTTCCLLHIVFIITTCIYC